MKVHTKRCVACQQTTKRKKSTLLNGNRVLPRNRIEYECNPLAHTIYACNNNKDSIYWSVDTIQPEPRTIEHTHKSNATTIVPFRA